MLSLMNRNSFVPSIFNDMDSFFDNSFFRRPFIGSRAETPAAMKTDIREEDGLYLMTMDLPGFNKEDVKAEIHDGYLTISAEKKEENEKKDDTGYVVRERYSGSCSRSFYVGEHVTQDNVKAAFQDGVLSLSFPKEEAQPEQKAVKYIEIA